MRFSAAARVLMAIDLALAAAMALSLLPAAPPPVPGAVQPVPPAALALAAQPPQWEPPDPAALNATRERPLFSPQRRPPPVAAAAAQPTRPFNAALLGVVVDGDRRIALVQRPGAKAERLEVGQIFDGWTVDSIESRRLVVSSNGQRRELDFPQRPRKGGGR